jgi:hypothetical protein
MTKGERNRPKTVDWEALAMVGPMSVKPSAIPSTSVSWPELNELGAVHDKKSISPHR